MVGNDAGAKARHGIASQSEAHRAAFRGDAHVSVAHIAFEDGYLDLPYDVGYASSMICISCPKLQAGGEQEQLRLPNLLL